MENHTPAQNGTNLSPERTMANIELDDAPQYDSIENTTEVETLDDTHNATDPTNDPEEVASPVEPLDPQLLSALGEATDDTPAYGEKILDNLANLWLPLLKKGLSKEPKEKLLKEYNIPDNCRLLQAPTLNAEIFHAIQDMPRNRDKNLTVPQQQLGSGITAINRAMEVLLKGQDTSTAIKHLSNACRILSDLHHMNTQSRIKLITPGLDRSFLHVIQDAERDETIFGSKLSEKIKAAKAIEKQGIQIKKVTAPNPKPSSSTHIQTPVVRPTYSGNWTAPPRYSSNRGGARGGKKTMQSSRRPYNAAQTYKPATSSYYRPRASNQ